MPGSSGCGSGRRNCWRVGNPVGKAQGVALGFLVAFAVGGVLVEMFGQKSQEIRDRQHAKQNDALRLRQGPRVKRESEGLKRLKAIKRVGDRMTHQYNRKQSNG